MKIRSVFAILLLFITGITYSQYNPMKEIDSLFDVNQPNKARVELIKIIDKAEKEKDNKILMLAYPYFEQLVYAMTETDKIDLLFDLFERTERYEEPAKSYTQLMLISSLTFDFHFWRTYSAIQNEKAVDINNLWNRHEFVLTYVEKIEKKLEHLSEYPFEEYKDVVFHKMRIPYEIPYDKDKEFPKLFTTLSDYFAYQLIGIYRSSLIRSYGSLKNIGTEANNTWLAISPEFVQQKIEYSGLNYRILRLYQHIEKNNLTNLEVLSNAVHSRLGYLETEYSITKDNKELFDIHYSFFTNSSGRCKFAYEKAKLKISEGISYHYKRKPEVESLIKEAHDIVKKEMADFPENDYATEITEMISQIEKVDIRFRVPDIILPNQAIPIWIQHRNIEDYVIRIYKVKNFNPLEIKNLMVYAQNNQLELVQTVDLKLIDKGLFQRRTTELLLEGIKENGNYFVVASEHKKDITKHASNYQEWNSLNLYTQSFTVSEIAVTQTTLDNINTILVVDKVTGKPIKNAEVKIYTYGLEVRNKYELYVSGFTDKNGLFTYDLVTSKSYAQYEYVVKHKTSTLYELKYNYSEQSEDKFHDVKLITDRSIYRPGQTVYFKGILYSGQEHDFEVLKDKKVSILVQNSSYEDVYKELFTTNEFGSFDGSFQLPSSGPLGNFRLSATAIGLSSKNRASAASFSVEEYKRPTFEVKIDTPEKEVKLNDTVQVKGTAKAYAGYPISNANVTYSVYRSWSRYWYFYNMESASDLLTENTVKTDEKGEFTIDFFAETDPNAVRFAYYFYEVRVKVTDLTGETREDVLRLTLNEIGLSLQVDLPSSLFTHEKGEFIPKVVNLSGKPQEMPNEGKIEIYKTVTSNRFLARIWENAEFSQIISKDQINAFENILFPYHQLNSFEEQTEEILIKTITFKPGISFSYEDFIKNELKSQQGAYRLKFSYTLDEDRVLEVDKNIEIIDVYSKKLPDYESLWTFISSSEAHVGEAVDFQVGSSFKGATALLSIYRENKLVSREWVTLDERFSKCYTLEEADRGYLTFNVILFQNNRFFVKSETVSVPYTNKELTIKTTTFRDQLQPGEKETWSFVIEDESGELSNVELAAAMYDASLDAYRWHGWSWWIHYAKSAYVNWSFAWNNQFNEFGIPYRVLNFSRLLSNKYPTYITKNSVTTHSKRAIQMSGDGFSDDLLYDKAPPAPMELYEETGAVNSIMEKTEGVQGGQGESPQETEDFNPRENFNETAFFYPTIYSDKENQYVLNFTLPESLTKWKLLMLAHNKELQMGTLTKTIEAKKELMITANSPRFVRQGDNFNFPAKVVNLTDEPQTVTVSLQLANPMNNEEISLIQGEAKKVITVPAQSSVDVSWNLLIGNQDLIQYTVMASNESFSDGERNTLPVLSSRVFLTETDHILIKNNGTVNHTFEAFKNQNTKTVDNKLYTVEYIDNLTWQAVIALPYLSKVNNQSITSLIDSYYANSIAKHIIDQNPQIQQVFNQWKQVTPDVFLSELDKNPELKNIVINETPWVIDAQNESEQRRRIALLFEVNQLENNQQSIVDELFARQNSDGGYSWFKGGESSLYLTQYVSVKLAQLKGLGIEDERLEYLIIEINNYIEGVHIKYYDETISKLKDKEKNKYRPSSTEIYWLYSRSFHNQMGSEKVEEVVQFYQERLKREWKNYNMYLQALIGIYFKAEGIDDFADLIYASLKDRAIKTDKIGTYWVENTGYFWYQNKISTQAMIIQFYEMMKAPSGTLDEMRLWLILNKEANRWSTGSETADAIFAILMSGKDYLASTPKPIISVGKNTFTFEKATENNQIEVNWTPGLGQVKHQWHGEEINKDLANISIEKHSDAPAVLILYWQYTDDLSNVKGSNNPSIQVEKNYYKIEAGTKGEVGIKSTEFSVGDKIHVEMIVTVDRDMEYVYIKDLRPAGFEPLDARSGYEWGRGTAYYQSPRDASMEFFVEWLRKGTYVFTYEVYATHSGEFNSGMTTVQCFYAPKFSGHSGTVEIKIGDVQK